MWRNTQRCRRARDTRDSFKRWVFQVDHRKGGERSGWGAGDLCRLIGAEVVEYQGGVGVKGCRVGDKSPEHARGCQRGGVGEVLVEGRRAGACSRAYVANRRGRA